MPEEIETPGVTVENVDAVLDLLTKLIELKSDYELLDRQYHAARSLIASLIQQYGVPVGDNAFQGTILSAIFNAQPGCIDLNITVDDEFGTTTIIVRPHSHN